MGRGRGRELPSAETVPEPVHDHAFSSGGQPAFRRLVQGEKRMTIKVTLRRPGGGERGRGCLLQEQELEEEYSCTGTEGPVTCYHQLISGVLVRESK